MRCYHTLKLYFTEKKQGAKFYLSVAVHTFKQVSQNCKF